MVAPFTCGAMSLQPSNCCGDEMGNPASITSTPSRASCSATSHLLLHAHRGPGGLLAVPQGGVEQVDAVHHEPPFSCRSVRSGRGAFFPRSRLTVPLRAISTSP